MPNQTSCLSFTMPYLLKAYNVKPKSINLFALILFCDSFLVDLRDRIHDTELSFGTLDSPHMYRGCLHTCANGPFHVQIYKLEMSGELQVNFILFKIKHLFKKRKGKMLLIQLQNVLYCIGWHARIYRITKKLLTTVTSSFSVFTIQSSPVCYNSILRIGFLRMYLFSKDSLVCFMLIEFTKYISIST